MAGIKISQLPALPVDSDISNGVIPISLSGTTYKVSGAIMNLGLEIAASYASINEAIYKRLIYVTSDENNNGDASLYLHNGAEIKFLLTIS